jgi:hypothetical protein
MTSLRDHPLMSYRGVGNWPPVWTLPAGAGTKTIRGEIGVLKYVHSATGRFPTNRCFLVVECEGHNYCGALLFDDRIFCSRIATILHNQLGHSIKDIGDLDLDHTL